MNESILETIRTMIGGMALEDEFDTDLIVCINSSLMSLNQIGVGPDGEPFHITGSSETWNQLLEDRTDLEAVKMIVYIKTKIVFDPPVNSFIVDAMERQVKEYEWRICSKHDIDIYDEENPEESED